MIGRVAARVAWLVVVAGIYLAGWGWLQDLRHVTLGPTVADALPLYENARHDQLSVAVVFVVWYVTALVALLPWRPRRRLVASAVAMALVLLGLGLLSGVQLALVRASVLGLDFGAALHTALPWIAALATGAAAGTLWLRPTAAVVALPVRDETPAAPAEEQAAAEANAPSHPISA